MTPSEIDPETVRLVSQCLNHYAPPGSDSLVIVLLNCNSNYLIFSHSFVQTFSSAPCSQTTLIFIPSQGFDSKFHIRFGNKKCVQKWFRNPKRCHFVHVTPNRRESVCENVGCTVVTLRCSIICCEEAM